MTDTFLAMHRISKLRYSIAGPLSPISIRDQMVRAKMFVDRAIDENLISETRPLFVVGAGVGGATAAIYAALMQIPTTLIDQRERPFHLQRQCSSRWINPTQYDWPAAHWAAAIYPWLASETGNEMPMDWSAGYANEVAAEWLHDLMRAQVEHAKFMVGYQKKFIGTNNPKVGDLLEVRYRNVIPGELELPLREARKRSKQYDAEALRRTTLYKEDCGALLEARGCEPEKVCIGRYRGFSFWDTDQFVKTDLGMNESAGRRKVLICGGGDGALQDLLRIATGEDSAASIMEKLQDQISKDLLIKIYSEEDQAYRARMWNGKKYDHESLIRLDRAHQDWAREILSSHVGGKLRKALEKMLRHSKSLEIELVHPCEHFTAFYPLNRFLVHLIAAVSDDRTARCGAPNPIRIRSKVAVTKILCQEHTDPSPKACMGKKHLVRGRDFPYCGARDTKALKDANSQLGCYDVVILRLGLEAEDPAERFRQLLYQRHLLPYHPPRARR